MVDMNWPWEGEASSRTSLQISFCCRASAGSRPYSWSIWDFWFNGSMVQSSMKKQPISNLFTSANHWLAFKILCLAVANQQCFYNEWISCAQYKLRSIRERVTIEVSFTDNLYFSEPFFAHVLWLVEEAFIKVVKPSAWWAFKRPTVRIYVTFSFAFTSIVFGQLMDANKYWWHLISRRLQVFTFFTNKLVPDTNSFSINELPKVATSLNNVEYCLNYSQCNQGRIDRSFWGEEQFLSQKQVLINAFSDSANAMIVLDGYITAVIKDSESFYLFDSHARNSRGMPDENDTAVVLEFSELNELQNHIETSASYLNVSIIEITPVHAYASLYYL